MTDYYTEFSTIIFNVKKREETWLRWYLSAPSCDELENQKFLELWMDVRHNPYKDLDNDPELWPHFDYEFYTEKGKAALSIFSCDSGCIEAVEHVAQQFLKKFRPKQCFAMEWGNTCSKLRTDGFGGGAIFVTAEGSKYISTSEWVNNHIEAHKGKEATHA